MKHWSRTVFGQFCLWLLIMIFAAGAYIAGFSSIYMATMDYYSLSEPEVEKQAIRYHALPDIENLSTQILFGNSMQYENYAKNTMDEYGIEYLRITDRGQNDKLIYEFGSEKSLKKDDSLRFDFTLDWGETYVTAADSLAVESEDDIQTNGQKSALLYHGPYGITAVYESDKPFETDIDLVKNLWAVRWYAPLAAAACLLPMLCLGAVLLNTAGKRPGSEEVFPGFFTRIPFDIFTLLILGFACAASLPLSIASNANFILCTLALGAAVLYLLILAILWLREVILRHRLGGVWRGSIIAACWHFAGRCWRGFLRLPLIPLTTAFVAALTFLEFAGILLFGSDILFLWILEKLILLPVIFYIALSCQKLRAHAHALAQGDLETTMDTSRMVGALKAHGDDLNSIASAIDTAVGQRTRSERFKAELITNVSHDIKTPLTSIINYTDLICRETCDNPRITEYAEVLHRQGERLKKLLVDLVEASKASTGNLEVHRENCRIDVLLDQAAGEYEQRFAQNDLSLVLSKPETGFVIHADGRHLWRVFDNLMNNICKYALQGTRVYVTLEKAGTNARLTFRNISREALNLTSDQLLERFARGDSSRTTEGSGLGLSIAQSLTELQGGEMALSVDGDLFKVVLSFPLLREEPLTPQAAPAEVEPAE